MFASRRRRWSRMLIASLCLLSLVWTARPAFTAASAFSPVANLFRSGRYAEAGEALASVPAADARPGEEILWRSRLAKRPIEALALLQPALGDRQVSGPTRIRIAYEVAEIQAGRGNHRAAVDALTPLISGDTSELPGAVLLRAGLSLRALGLLQKAREMLASVKSGDPDFALARYYLGDIGLEQKDPVLAQRYFEAAAKAAGEQGSGRMAAGLWRAHRASGRESEAAGLLKQLAAGDPGSLALLEIRRYEQLAADERLARDPSAAPRQSTGPAAPAAGRFTLQLGAFSDRGRALDFQKRLRGQVNALRIDKLSDDRGQFVYKVRTGEYVNPAEARSAAQLLAEKLGLEVIVAEMDGTAVRLGE